MVLLLIIWEKSSLMFPKDTNALLETSDVNTEMRGKMFKVKLSIIMEFYWR